MMDAKKHVIVVVPCLNEAGVLKHCYDALMKVFDDDYCSEHNVAASVVFGDDGSDDSTWEEIYHMADEHANVSGIRLSRNFGQQPAVLAGYESALFMDADAVVVMDLFIFRQYIRCTQSVLGDDERQTVTVPVFI